MTLGRARRARARALVVPVVMSAPMWLVAGELVLGWYDPVRQLGRYGPAALTLVVVAVLAAAADTGPRERWLARVFLRARAPRLHQRHALAPVAEVLLRHGVPPQGLELLVGPGQQVGVTALGRRTVVASRGLIEAVWSGQLGPEQAAAVITHEVGVMRSKLTRHDPAMMVLLAPWKVWITWIAVMWGFVAAFLSHRVLVACLVVHAGVGIWLGVTEEPFMFVSTVVMAVVLATWWAIRSWDRARAQVGDQYLLQHDLAGIYADLLTATFTDDYTRDRAVRLRHPQLQQEPPGRRGLSAGVENRAQYDGPLGSVPRRAPLARALPGQLFSLRPSAPRGQSVLGRRQSPLAVPSRRPRAAVTPERAHPASSAPRRAPQPVPARTLP